MRTSAGSLVIILSQDGENVRYLLRYNSDVQGLTLVGGYREPLETFNACAQRGLSEAFDIMPDRGFSMHHVPVAQLKYRAFSESKQQEAWFHHWLFEAVLDAEVIDKVDADPLNCWVTLDEIEQGQSKEGQVISGMVSLLFCKTARLPSLANPNVYTIGVIGHREWTVTDTNLVCSSIELQLKHAEKLAQGKPIIMLSSLAMGADQLMAEVGLMRGYSLVSPLPFYRDIYQQEFGQKQGRLRTFLDQTSEWFSLPSPAGITREDFLEDQLLRDYFYKLAGELIVNRSNYLLAVWDGKDQLNFERTAATINYAAQRLKLPEEVFYMGVVNVER